MKTYEPIGKGNVITVIGLCFLLNVCVLNDSPSKKTTSHRHKHFAQKICEFHKSTSLLASLQMQCYSLQWRRMRQRGEDSKRKASRKKLRDRMDQRSWDHTVHALAGLHTDVQHSTHSMCVCLYNLRFLFIRYILQGSFSTSFLC